MATTTTDGPDHPGLTDIGAGLVLAAMAGVALVWLIPDHVGGQVGENDIGPAMFPRLTAWMVLVLSLMLSTRAAFRYRASVTREQDARGWWLLIEAFAWVLVGGLTLLGLSRIGFVPTAMLLVVFGAVVSGYRTWWVIAVLGLGFPFAVDRLVWLVFTVDLP